MLSGFAGHLVSEQLLEQTVAIGREPTSTERRVALRTLRSAQRVGPATSLRGMQELGAQPILDALGFGRPADLAALNGCLFGTIAAGGRPVGLLVAPWGERLDPLWRTAVVSARARGACWCVLFNGTHVRIVDAERVYSRRYAEFDLDAAADDDRTFGALSAIAGANALASGADGTTPLDRFVAASERHAAAVCHSLRDGVLDASQHVLAALTHRPVQSIEAAFEQALTIVYRILFLLFAEARSLVPLWHPVYRESYSIERLCTDALARRAHGLWDALRAVSRLAHAGCRAGDLRVTPFNGRLFAPARTPLAERRDLDDEAARRSLISLASRPAADGQGRDTISYRDLGVEQLGAVYETLLDYRPVRETPRVTLRRGSGVRKATGTFYTPQPIARHLIRQALGPLVRGATPEQILQLRVLDPSMGSGAFLVGACGYLADAYETALVESGGYHAADFGAAEHAVIQRTIAERCLYGVDLNPMAVQLARLSLWLTSLAADRPLSFLDHHLVVGDSLLGTWLARLRQPPATRHHRAGALPLFDDAAVADAVKEALPVRFDLALAPNDTPQQVRAKERALAALTARDTALAKWKRIADLWCSRWFAAKRAAPVSAFPELSDAILTGRCGLPPTLRDDYLQASDECAAERRFFHWELEFPEVFFDAGGHRLPTAGFDAVIGNPPWDMVRGDSGSSHDRERARQRSASVVRFTRDSGVYEGQSDGHANRYQLFLERVMALTRPGGRFGLVMPSGLTADHGSARLRRLLLSRCAVDSIVGFDNRKAIFPIHRSVRFVLVTATNGSPTTQIACRFGETDPAVLETLADDGTSPVRLSPAIITKLSGEDASIPGLRSAADLQIVERAATLFPPLGAPAGWHARFGRELNASDDRAFFRNAGSVPIVEGKQLEPFRCDVKRSRVWLAERDAVRLLRGRHQHARLAYRDVASATNRQTLIAAILPAGCASTHTVFCLRTPFSRQAQDFLCGLFNSFIVNYLVRLRVTTHVTTAIVERLPIPREDHAGAAFGAVAAMARGLARRDDRELIARLNATVAALYQLTSEELAHILTTFPLVPQEQRDAAMQRFRRQA